MKNFNPEDYIYVSAGGEPGASFSIRDNGSVTGLASAQKLMDETKPPGWREKDRVLILSSWEKRFREFPDLKLPKKDHPDWSQEIPGSGTSTMTKLSWGVGFLAIGGALFALGLSSFWLVGWAALPLVAGASYLGFRSWERSSQTDLRVTTGDLRKNVPLDDPDWYSRGVRTMFSTPDYVELMPRLQRPE